MAQKKVEIVRIWMIFEDNTFWASPPMERYFAELILYSLSQGDDFPEQPNKRVIRAKLI